MADHTPAEHEEDISPDAFVPVDDSGHASEDISPEHFASVEEAHDHAAEEDFLSALARHASNLGKGLADGATLSHGGEIGNFVADHMPGPDHSIDGQLPTHQGSRHEDYQQVYDDARQTMPGKIGNFIGNVSSGATLGRIAGPAKAAQALAGAAQGAGTAHGEGGDALSMLAGGALGAAVPYVAPYVAQGAKALARKVLPNFENLMNERAYKALVGKTSIGSVRKAGDVAGARELGRSALDEGIVSTGSTAEQQAERAALKRSEVGQRIGGLVDDLDSAGAQPSPRALAARVRQQAIDPLKNSAVTREMGNALEGKLANVLGELDKGTTGQYKTFRSIWDDRRKWDALLGYEKQSASPMTAELRAARAALEQGFSDNAEQVAGSSWREAYQPAKKLYSHVAQADDLAQEALNGKLANRLVSPSDHYLAGIGAAAGATAGGPLGASAGAVLGAVGNKLARERGSSAVAGALYKFGVGQPAAGGSLGKTLKSSANATTTWAIQHVLASGDSGLPPEAERQLTAAVLSDDPQKLNATHFQMQSRYPKFQKQVQRASELAGGGEP